MNYTTILPCVESSGDVPQVLYHMFAVLPSSLDDSDLVYLTLLDYDSVPADLLITAVVHILAEYSS
jgi:hypothetical protein